MVDRNFEMSPGFTSGQVAGRLANGDTIPHISPSARVFEMQGGVVEPRGIRPDNRPDRDLPNQSIHADLGDFQEHGPIDGEADEIGLDGREDTGWAEEPARRRLWTSSGDMPITRLLMPAVYGIGALVSIGYVYFVFFSGSGQPPQSSYRPPVLQTTEPPVASTPSADNPMSPSLALPNNLTTTMSPTAVNQNVGQASAASAPLAAPPVPAAPLSKPMSPRQGQQVAASTPTPQLPNSTSSISAPPPANVAPPESAKPPSDQNYATADQVNHLAVLLGQLSTSVAALSTKLDGTETTTTEIHSEVGTISDKLASVATATNQIEHEQIVRSAPPSPTTERHESNAAASPPLEPGSASVDIATKQVLKGYDLRGYSSTAVVVGTPYGAVTVQMNGTVPGAGEAIGVFQYAPGQQGIELVTSEGLIRPAPTPTS